VLSKWHEIAAQEFNYWTIIGFLGGAMFFSRFYVQWIVSEHRKESVIPVSFWYLSIFGSLFLLAYSIHKAEPIFILMYLPNCFIYSRNLYLIHKKKKLSEA
jgi:lipid-A-disaccharide synthase-like uncharacterized protein